MPRRHPWKGVGFGLRPPREQEFLIPSKKSTLLMGAGTLSVAALIVAKMLALNWVGDKMQKALRKP